MDAACVILSCYCSERVGTSMSGGDCSAHSEVSAVESRDTAPCMLFDLTHHDPCQARSPHVSRIVDTSKHRSVRHPSIPTIPSSSCYNLWEPRKCRLRFVWRCRLVFRSHLRSAQQERETTRRKFQITETPSTISDWFTCCGVPPFLELRHDGTSG